MSSVWVSLDIEHHLTCPYTLKQNNPTESRLRRVVECALVLLFKGVVLIKYLFYACRSTVYL